MNEPRQRAALVEARLPKGFPDIDGENLRAIDTLVQKIQKVYTAFGYRQLHTPMVEYTDTLGKFLPDADRPNMGVFSFRDDDEQWLSLRYDLTAPLARYVAQNMMSLPKPVRSMRAGWIFRNEKPGPGRFRQFMQCDADIVGTSSLFADAEICMMAVEAFIALGLSRGEYVIKVNNRKVLDGILFDLGLNASTDTDRRLIVMRALDKWDRLGDEGVRALLGKGRMDASGDFTKGAQLPQSQIDQLLDFLQSNSESNKDTLTMLKELTTTFPSISEGVDELATIARACAERGYGDDQISIDPSIVRGLEYYTGPVFEAHLLFDVVDENGIVQQVGSVGGGGRYDGLVARFLPDPMPATGFSVGVNRILMALQARKLVDAHSLGPVVVTVMDKDRMDDYFALAEQLRKAGIETDLYLGSSGMKAQMKYANRLNSPCVVIQGTNEREQSTVMIKDLIEGARLALNISDNATWKAERPAQIEVAVSQMVGQVRDIVDFHQKSLRNSNSTD